MRRTRATGVAAIGATMTMWLTGCGDDSEQISRPDFIETANTLCLGAQEEIDEMFASVWDDPGDGDSDAEREEQVFVAFAAATHEAEPVMHGLADDLRDLGAPAGDEELLADLFDDLDAAIDEFTATVDAAVAGDVAAREALAGEGESAAMDDVNRRAREYGLDVCGAES